MKTLILAALLVVGSWAVAPTNAYADSCSLAEWQDMFDHVANSPNATTSERRDAFHGFTDFLLPSMGNFWCGYEFQFALQDAQATGAWCSTWDSIFNDDYCDDQRYWWLIDWLWWRAHFGG